MSVIGVAYTEHLSIGPLVVAGLALVGIFVLDRVKVWRAGPYVLLVLIAWVATLGAGLHASIAGMLAGLLVPAAEPTRAQMEVATSRFRAFRQSPLPTLQRETRDKLSDSEFLVGRQYYRTRWYPGAVSRLSELIKADPQYTRRDGAYFYLAEAYYKQGKKPEALALYEKLIGEFRVSDYLKDARERIAELQAANVQVADSTTAPGTAPAAEAKAEPEPLF